MAERAILQNCDEAMRFIDQIPDPITRSLVNLVFVHVVKDVHFEQESLPQTDVDMLFLVTTLAVFFSEHDVLARTLAGEKVGAWFEDD